MKPTSHLNPTSPGDRINPEHPASHFVYQKIHVPAAGAGMRAGQAAGPPHLAAHLDLASRTFQHIYGVWPNLDEKRIARKIADVVAAKDRSGTADHIVMLRLFPTEEGFREDTPGEDGGREEGGEESGFTVSDGRSVLFGPGSGETVSDGRSVLFGPGSGETVSDGRSVSVDIEHERLLLDAGYSLSPLRPKAVSWDYAIPFGGFPTGFQLSARVLFDSLALSLHGATRSVRRTGNKLISCGDAPLFGIRGKTLFTASFTDGAMESVERRLVVSAARTARLDFLEEAVPHSELSLFDELFFADPAGITSLSEVDGTRFMSLVAARLVAAIRG